MCGLTLGAGAADERTLSADGKTLTFNVGAGVVYTNETAIESTVTAIVKTGAGDACLGNRTNTTFKGTIDIHAGYLSGLEKCFGNPSTIGITNGAAILFTDFKSATFNANGPFRNTKFYIAGAGPDGNGAIQRPYAHCDFGDHGFTSYLEMLDDAMINVGCRWGFANTTLVMNNHELSFSATKHDSTYNASWCCFDFRNTLTVKHPGSIRLTGAARISVESVTFADAPGSNGLVTNMPFYVESGCVVRMFDRAKPFPCPMHFGDGATIRNYRNSSTSDLAQYNHFSGSIDFTGKLIADSYQGGDYHYTTFWFDGPVTGTGTLQNKTQGGLFFTGAWTNSFKNLAQDANGWTELRDDVQLKLGGAGGGSALVSSSSVTYPGRLVLRGNSRTLDADTTRTNRVTYHVGGQSNPYYGMVSVYDHAVMSNAVEIGYSGRGAVRLFGGEFTQIDGNRSGNNIFIGQNTGAYGYLGINDGVYRQSHWANVGTVCPGFIVQRGGTAWHGNSANSYSYPLRLANTGATSYGCLAMLGGVSHWTKQYVALNFRNYPPTGAGSTAAVIVSGRDAELDLSSSYIIVHAATNAANPVTGFVDIRDGGTLKAQYLYTGQVSGGEQPTWATFKDRVPAATRTYLNFDGGVLVTTRAGEFFYASDPTRFFTRATVYAGGATIDTNGKDVTWRMPLERPYGHGIASIGLPANAVATNAYLGPARCLITSSAGGVGADALMDFDDTNRVARGMIVASPGFGYEATPTVKVHQPDVTKTWDCTVTTVDFDAPEFVHGGLTKRGAGTLTLTSTNTYGGATRVEKGTLAFTHADGYPGGDLEFPAGAVTNCAAPLVTAPKMVFRSGAKVRVTGADELVKECVRGVQTLVTTTEPITALPTVEWTDDEGMPVAMNGAWIVRLGAGGKSIEFAYSRGTVMLLR